MKMMHPLCDMWNDSKKEKEQQIERNVQNWHKMVQEEKETTNLEE
jgi:hypothetical protein